jgi:cell pole-organizing protein PopZ
MQLFYGPFKPGGGAGERMASNPQHEPTMEEILASIRKIISEDSNEAQALDGHSNGGVPAASDADDVYELREGDVIEESPPVAATPPTPTPEPARVMQMVPRAEVQPTVEPHEESIVTASVSAAASGEVHAEAQEGFFSDSARKAMHETFARLEPVTDDRPGASAPAPVNAAPAGASVQDVFEHAIREQVGPMASEFLKTHADEIVERMKPIVREWMDEHFPAILEGAVRNEVERAVRAAASTKPRR